LAGVRGEIVNFFDSKKQTEKLQKELMQILRQTLSFGIDSNVLDLSPDEILKLAEAIRILKLETFNKVNQTLKIVYQACLNEFKRDPKDFVKIINNKLKEIP
jgi:hypothetical protein